MRNQLLAVLGAASFAFGVSSCNPQETLSTSSNQENVAVAPRLESLPADFIFSGSNARTGIETDDVTIDESNIVVKAVQDGTVVEGCTYSFQEKAIKSVPYGFVDFSASYAAVIPAGHQIATGTAIHNSQLKEDNAHAVLDYMRELREPVVNFESATQSQDINSAAVLEPFVMMPQNGRMAIGISFDAPSSYWRLAAELTVFDKNGKQIAKVDGIPVEQHSPNNEYSIGFDFTDTQAVTGAYVHIKIEANEYNSQGERVFGPQDKKWILDGAVDDTYKLENGISKGIAIDISRDFTPTFTDVSSEFQFVQLVIDDEVVELD
ncbi:hypothetical protein [Flammeovirga agarivorans]|uniref:Lipoprotein n=1 Tax=Flammeovirga agarivorans TaxID=2726742 RepID=A0A7X8XW80_9BACT|nr:hypothetical protein [Flammeovirga agarivorans]NLR92072.1 hypothetical protein [Flammeovirga agarivorans]